MAGVSGLRESEFKITGAGAAGGRPQEIIVFIVGGATYAEARCDPGLKYLALIKPDLLRLSRSKTLPRRCSFLRLVTDCLQVRVGVQQRQCCERAEGGAWWNDDSQHSVICQGGAGVSSRADIEERILHSFRN